MKEEEEERRSGQQHTRAARRPSPGAIHLSAPCERPVEQGVCVGGGRGGGGGACLPPLCLYSVSLFVLVKKVLLYTVCGLNMVLSCAVSSSSSKVVSLSLFSLVLHRPRLSAARVSLLSSSSRRTSSYVVRACVSACVCILSMSSLGLLSAIANVNDPLRRPPLSP